VLDPRRRRAVAEGGYDAPAHRHLPGQAVDAPDQLARRSQIAVRQRHRVGDANDAPGGRECRLQDVGVGQIASLHLRGKLRLEQEAAAAIGIEHGCEHARRVEVGQAQPVDGSVAGAERDGARVADRP
jgi:hypothetical protein